MSADLEARAFRRRGNTLVPSDEYAGEFLNGIPDGKEVLITIRQPRSIQHHKFFLKLIRVTLDNTDAWQDVDELLDALKHASGHVERRRKLDGTYYLAPKHINFGAMKEEPFKRFKARCLYLLGSVLGIDPIELLNEVNASERAA